MLPLDLRAYSRCDGGNVALKLSVCDVVLAVMCNGADGVAEPPHIRVRLLWSKDFQTRQALVLLCHFYGDSYHRRAGVQRPAANIQVPDAL